MRTFIAYCRNKHIPRDGFTYPRAYDVVNEWLTNYITNH